MLSAFGKLVAICQLEIFLGSDRGRVRNRQSGIPLGTDNQINTG